MLPEVRPSTLPPGTSRVSLSWRGFGRPGAGARARAACKSPTFVSIARELTVKS